MSEWKKVKLGECITTKKGFAFKSTQYVDKGIPVVRVSDFTLNSISENDLVYYPISEYDKYLDYILYEKDILIQTVGSWQYNPNSVVGKVVRVPYYHKGSLLNQNIVKVIPNDDIYKDFVYYRLKCIDFSGFVVGEARGAANQASITLDTIKRFSFLLPSYDTQHRIATILSRYDSLIENYQRQIKLLEEAAQRLYKEWFVDLHFPGHENTKIVDGVPEGWEKRKLIEFGCSLESGARPKGGVDLNLKDGIPSVGAENVIGLGKYNYSSEKLITNQFYSQMRKGKIKDRDILIYKDGAYIGRTSLFQDGFPHKEMAVNEHVFLLHTLNENYQYFVFFTLYQKQYFEKMQKLNKNAAQPGLNQKALLDLGILRPSENFVSAFRKEVEPLMKALFSKANQIHLLTEARDRLLPKLMSGEIIV